MQRWQLLTQRSLREVFQPDPATPYGLRCSAGAPWRLWIAHRSNSLPPAPAGVAANSSRR